MQINYRVSTLRLAPQGSPGRLHEHCSAASGLIVHPVCLHGSLTAPGDIGATRHARANTQGLIPAAQYL